MGLACTGLGGTQGNPITTGAEENVLCAPPDRYGNEDILLHELAHGVHLLGARYAISGWHDRLQEAYNSAQTSGLWENTYAMSTFKEYFVSICATDLLNQNLAIGLAI